MSSAFRYSGQKYNDALLALGNVRIGTLHDFRKAEHKKGISDSNEGMKTVTHKIIRATDKDDGTMDSKALRTFNALQFTGENILVEGLRISQGFNHPDCFVHCSAIEYSRKVLAEFEGADSCVEIHDVVGFYIRLTQSLQLHCPVDLHQVASVEYMKRVEDWNGKNWGGHPAFIKEPEFKRQVELRAVWIPRSSNEISPVVINDIGLLRFCRSRKLPK